MTEPLKHEDVAKKSDDALREEARTHLARSPKLQVVAELLDKLRQLALPWWAPQRLRSAFPSAQRMAWLSDRADLRQTITSGLTGLAPKASRALKPDAQAQLLDAVVDCGDIACEKFEAAFDPRDVVVYGPVVSVWKLFREAMPWEAQTHAHQDLVAWLIRIVLADKGETGPRRPLLTHYDVRTAIDRKVWHTSIPLEVRVAIDEARLGREKVSTRDPFLARHELEIATPEVLTAHVPLRELQPIFVVAEKALGFETAAELVTKTTAKPSGVTLPPPPPPREARATRASSTSKSGAALDAKPIPMGEDTDILFEDELVEATTMSPS